MVPNTAREACGLSTWDWLGQATAEELAEFNRFMHSEDPRSLKTGYVIQLRQYKELDLASRLMADLAAGRVFEDVDLRDALNSLPTRTQVLLRDETSGQGMLLHPEDVGEGVSQLVPVIGITLGRQHDLLMTEQPELHVHQTIQANLGDVFLYRVERSMDEFNRLDDLAPLRWPVRQLVETHSEPLLLRVMRRIRQQTKDKKESAIKPEDVRIYFFSRKDDSIRVIPIDVTPQGDLTQPWPDEQFEVDFAERFAR